MTWAILAAFLGLIGTVAGIATSSNLSDSQNAANKDMQESANQKNIQLAREANAAQAAESEKAFQRSKATSQVNLMRAAGMSKAGALNALSGGGVYTPAPVNTAQVTAPYQDNSGLQSALGMLSL